MSNFFDKSDLSRKDADKIVSDTLQNCDDGELYLEDTKSESILLDDNKIKSSSYSSDLGFGFRAISGEIVAYSHSNEISKNSLKKSSENLKYIKFIFWFLKSHYFCLDFFGKNYANETTTTSIFFTDKNSSYVY